MHLEGPSAIMWEPVYLWEGLCLPATALDGGYRGSFDLPPPEAAIGCIKSSE